MNNIYLAQETPAYRYNHSLMLMHLGKHMYGTILEGDQKNSLTYKIYSNFGITADNISGDFDTNIICGDKEYDIVISSSVIEHLFNPLYYVTELRKRLKDDGVFIIASPKGTMFSYGHKYHFHEQNLRQTKALMERAGFECILHREYPRCFNAGIGIRPLLRKRIEKYMITEWIKGTKKKSIYNCY